VPRHRTRTFPPNAGFAHFALIVSTESSFSAAAISSTCSVSTASTTTNTGRTAPCACCPQTAATERHSKRLGAYAAAISSAGSSPNTRPPEVADPTAVAACDLILFEGVPRVARLRAGHGGGPFVVSRRHPAEN